METVLFGANLRANLGFANHTVLLETCAETSRMETMRFGGYHQHGYQTIIGPLQLFPIGIHITALLRSLFNKLCCQWVVLHALSLISHPVQ